MTDSAPPDTSHAAGSSARFGVVTGTSLIVANIIGTGIFMTTGFMVGAIPSPPTVLLAYVRFYDTLQHWLITHAVGMRHQEHKVLHLHLMNVMPSRAQGLALPTGGYPVMQVGAAGIISWLAPRINFIDSYGLNDYVIARNPDISPGLMAHERKPPSGYAECFVPNVRTGPGKVFAIHQRAKDLTAEQIVECERRYELTVRGYSEHVGDLFVFRSCVLGRKSRDMLEGKLRKEPVAFSYATSESDVIDIDWPAEYAVDEIPPPVKYDYPFAAYRSETRTAEHALHYARTYELKDVRVPVDKLEDLKKFFREVTNDERAYTVLKLQ